MAAAHRSSRPVDRAASSAARGDGPTRGVGVCAETLGIKTLGTKTLGTKTLGTKTLGTKTLGRAPPGSDSPEGDGIRGGKVRGAIGGGRRASWRVLVGVALGGVCLVPRAGRAAGGEQSAVQLADRAMNDDFTNARFDAAARNLQDALQACGQSACKPKTLARIHRDLAVVSIIGLEDAAAGEEHFAAALRADPGVQLDPVFTTPEVEAAFQRAQSARPAGGLKLEDETLVHTPVSEQRKGIPVPLYVELAAGVKADSVRIRYRAAGGETWEIAPMSRHAEGYQGEIPCAAVRAGGSVDYYVEARDADREVIGTAGSRETPFKVELVDELSGTSPRVPGRPAPRACSAGASTACSSDADCEHGAACGADGICASSEQAEPRGPSTAWLELGVRQDLVLTGGQDVCTQQSQVDGTFSCFTAGGAQYHGTPLAGGGGKIGSGFAFGPSRVVVGAAVAVSEQLSLDVRTGLAFAGGGPRPDGGHSFLPVHLELGGSYWFGKVRDAHAITPFVGASAGMIQIDGAAKVIVTEDPNAPKPASQLGNPPQQELEAYKKLGAGFVAVGGGVFVPFGGAVGMVADLKLSVLFPSSGLAASAGAGLVVGL